MATRVSPAEAVGALVALAERRIDVSEIRNTLNGLPEVTRRPGEVCELSDADPCRLFGVTWWLPEGTYAGYRVCLTHRYVSRPTGPLARRLPAPKSAPSLRVEGEREKKCALVLAPRTKEIAWALADGAVVVEAGAEPLRLSSADSSMYDVALEAGAWLQQLIQMLRPWAVLLLGGAGIEVFDSEHRRLNSLGIEVRTTYIDAPVSGYRDFLRMERIRGVVQGIAYAHCSGRVYTAPVFRTGERPSFPVAPPPEIEEAFLVAASALAERADAADDASAGASR